MADTVLGAAYAVVGALFPFSFAEPAFMKRAILAMVLISPAAAAVGVPLVQFRMAFFSDAIGHSAFAGIALGVVLGIDPVPTMVVFGLLVALAIILVKGRTELSPDTVIGVFFSTSIALGIAIISARKGLVRILHTFLYGDLLTVTETEVLWIAGLFLLVGIFLFFFLNRLLLLGIHEGFAMSLGVPVRLVEVAYALVVALVVTTAIRAVGILLVTALLVVPAAAARNVAHGAAGSFWIAVAISVASGISGIAASYYLDTATGATVVLMAAACFAVTAAWRVAVQRPGSAVSPGRPRGRNRKRRGEAATSPPD